jgi:hypothetical protein
MPECTLCRVVYLEGETHVCVPRSRGKVLGFLSAAAAAIATSSVYSLVYSEGERPLLGYVLGILVALIAGAMAEALGSGSARRKQQVRNYEVQSGTSKRPTALLLRPFRIDNHALTAAPGRSTSPLAQDFWNTPDQVTLEASITNAAGHDYDVRVIGGSVLGPGVIDTPDFLWRSKFREAALAARIIFVIPLPGQELGAELRELKDRQLLDKTLMVLPPLQSIQEPQRQFFREALPAFLEALRKDGLDVSGPSDDQFTLLRLNNSGGLQKRETTPRLDRTSLRGFLYPGWWPLW